MLVRRQATRVTLAPPCRHQKAQLQRTSIDLLKILPLALYLVGSALDGGPLPCPPACRLLTAPPPCVPMLGT